MHANTIGVDLAKNVFQVHGVDSTGKVVITRQLRRKQVLDFFSKLPGCLVGMEACGTGHHWAREISKLGHTVRLMPPSYVKGYVKRSKNDAADAAAICEAVTRPSMRFVPIKSTDQQALLMLHRTRDLLIRQRTQLINAPTLPSSASLRRRDAKDSRSLARSSRTRVGHYQITIKIGFTLES
jgi:transposase